MWEDKETTAPIPSVAPDGEQPSAFARTVSITEIEETRKQFGKIQIMSHPLSLNAQRLKRVGCAFFLYYNPIGRR